MCREPESNWRHLPLQGSALPTELSRRWLIKESLNILIRALRLVEVRLQEEISYHKRCENNRKLDESVNGGPFCSFVDFFENFVILFRQS